MGFVPVKSASSSLFLLCIWSRPLLVRQRTASIDAVRELHGEFGPLAAKGSIRVVMLRRRIEGMEPNLLLQQIGSAPKVPIFMAWTFRRRSALTPTAMMAGDYSPSARRTFRQVASIHSYGQSPSISRSTKAFALSSISSHSREPWLLEMPLIPAATHHAR